MDELDSLLPRRRLTVTNVPEDLGEALTGLADMANTAHKEAIALAILLGAMVGRSAPAKEEPLNKAALAAIELAKTMFPSALVPIAFESAMTAVSRPPPTDGDGLPIDASKVIELFKKAA